MGDPFLEQTVSALCSLVLGAGMKKVRFYLKAPSTQNALNDLCRGRCFYIKSPTVLVSKSCFFALHNQKVMEDSEAALQPALWEPTL